MGLEVVEDISGGWMAVDVPKRVLLVHVVVVERKVVGNARWTPVAVHCSSLDMAMEGMAIDGCSEEI